MKKKVEELITTIQTKNKKKKREKSKEQNLSFYIIKKDNYTKR